MSPPRQRESIEQRVYLLRSKSPCPFLLITMIHSFPVAYQIYLGLSNAHHSVGITLVQIHEYGFMSNSEIIIVI